MSNYVLQIHGRDLDINVSSRSVLGDRHTGYDLIEYGNDGSIIKIQTLDLIKNNSNGKIEILFTESFDQQPIVFSDGDSKYGTIKWILMAKLTMTLHRNWLKNIILKQPS